MKKILAGIVFALVAFPLISSAQTVTNSNATLIAVLTQLVQVLEAEIQELIYQKSISMSTTTNTQIQDQTLQPQQGICVANCVVNQIKQPLYGSITPMPKVNTTPTITTQVSNDLIIKPGMKGEDDNVVSYDVHAFYTENGQPVDGAVVTVTGSDGGSFTNMNNSDLAQVDTATGNADDPRGLFKGSVKLYTHDGQGYKGLIYFVYTPKGQNSLLTFTVNGLTKTIVGYDQN